ncbi:hypothetical protein EVC45_38530 [Paraburkholderia sp. UYCP14C]|uniref:hypothetical protein n=1 Tax=Paraburkholderia sp. UYCP14C TaxID=2511130 RepID=UPI001020F517|nr:hypothetical protein [Paraburkholderia sp. UYCP14C]RZF24510.1 hypothetical protein EVC45_38530 [Paraburkholderia sp. UYCP14C]
MKRHLFASLLLLFSFSAVSQARSLAENDKMAVSHTVASIDYDQILQQQGSGMTLLLTDIPYRDSKHFRCLFIRDGETLRPPCYWWDIDGAVPVKDLRESGSEIDGNMVYWRFTPGVRALMHDSPDASIAQGKAVSIMISNPDAHEQYAVGGMKSDFRVVNSRKF